MNSKLALLLPIISLVYLFQTIFFRKLKAWFKFLLTIFAIAIVVLDVFVYLVFFVNCIEQASNSMEGSCLQWVYPTLDFVVMIIASAILVFFAFWGLAKHWKNRTFYWIGSSVFYLGVVVRLMLLIEVAGVISIADDSSNSIVFEIFSIVIVYGLISAVFYFAVFFMGMVTRLPFRQ